MMKISTVIAAALAGLALIFGVIALTRRETWRPAAGALVLGASAIAIQVFIWAIAVIAGVIVIWIIVSHMGDIFSPEENPA